jgi:hypothetical protein
VRLGARHAELKEPIEVTIERIDNPATLSPDIATTGTTPITGFYQVRSPKRTVIHPGQLTVGIPYPEGAPKEGLAVVFLVQGGEDSASDDEYQWSFTPATYAPTTNEILFGLKYAGPEGMPFVIVSGRYPNVATNTLRIAGSEGILSAQAEGSIPINIVCSNEFDPGE